MVPEWGGLKTEDKDKYADLCEIEELKNLEVAGNSDGDRYGAWADLTFLIAAASLLPLRNINVLEKLIRQTVMKPRKKRPRCSGVKSSDSKISVKVSLTTPEL